MTFAEIVRQVLTPLLATYVLVLGMIAMTARRARRASWLPGPDTWEPAGALRQAGRILSLLLVGYAAFFSIVLTYYAVVANESPEFLRAAAAAAPSSRSSSRCRVCCSRPPSPGSPRRRPRGSPAA